MTARFQFSIRFLLVATAAVAAGVAVVRAEQSTESLLAMNCLSLLFATVAILGVKETGGTLRIFWIGTAIVLGPLAIQAVQHSIDILPYLGTSDSGSFRQLHNYVWPVWCAAPVNGVCAILLRRLFTQRQNPNA